MDQLTPNNDGSIGQRDKNITGSISGALFGVMGGSPLLSSLSSMSTPGFGKPMESSVGSSPGNTKFDSATSRSGSVRNNYEDNNTPKTNRSFSRSSSPFASLSNEVVPNIGLPPTESVVPSKSVISSSNESAPSISKNTRLNPPQSAPSLSKNSILDPPESAPSLSQKSILDPPESEPKNSSESAPKNLPLQPESSSSLPKNLSLLTESAPSLSSRGERGSESVLSEHGHLGGNTEKLKEIVCAGGVDLDADGNIVVSGSSGESVCTFAWPVHVMVDSNGSLVISDQKNHVVVLVKSIDDKQQKVHYTLQDKFSIRGRKNKETDNYSYGVSSREWSEEDIKQSIIKEVKQETDKVQREMEQKVHKEVEKVVSKEVKEKMRGLKKDIQNQDYKQQLQTTTRLFYGVVSGLLLAGFLVVFFKKIKKEVELGQFRFY